MIYGICWNETAAAADVAVPGPPIDVHVSQQSSSSCTVTWKCPRDDGGSPITGYIVHIDCISTSESTQIETKDVKQLQFTVADLQSNATYQFRVIAENEVGQGPSSESAQLHMSGNCLYIWRISTHNTKVYVDITMSCLLLDFDKKLAPSVIYRSQLLRAKRTLTQ